MLRQGIEQTRDCLHILLDAARDLTLVAPCADSLRVLGNGLEELSDLLQLIADLRADLWWKRSSDCANSEIILETCHLCIALLVVIPLQRKDTANC